MGFDEGFCQGDGGGRLFLADLHDEDLGSEGTRLSGTPSLQNCCLTLLSLLLFSSSLPPLSLS